MVINAGILIWLLLGSPGGETFVLFFTTSGVVGGELRSM